MGWNHEFPVMTSQHSSVVGWVVIVKALVCILKHIFTYSIFSDSKDTGGGHLGVSVKPQSWAQVVISQLVSSSPTSGSVLTAQSLEPASDSVSVCLSVSLNKQTNKQTSKQALNLFSKRHRREYTKKSPSFLSGSSHP